MPTFLEGVESIGLWCSLVVILPMAVTVLATSGRRAWLVGGAIGGTATMMWARAGRLWDFEPDGMARWPLGVAIIVVFVAIYRPVPGGPPVGIGLGLVAGAIAGWLWQPCVGEHFAQVLNRAETERLTSLVAMHAYVVGLSLPAILLAALPPAWPRSAALLGHRRVRQAALATALVYGLSVAAGWYDDLVSELFRWSSS